MHRRRPTTTIGVQKECWVLPSCVGARESTRKWNVTLATMCASCNTSWSLSRCLARVFNWRRRRQNVPEGEEEEEESEDL